MLQFARFVTYFSPIFGENTHFSHIYLQIPAWFVSRHKGKQTHSNQKQYSHPKWKSRPFSGDNFREFLVEWQNGINFAN